MTNYYVKFDSDGNQIETRYGLDAENPTGWLDTGLSDISDKQFKLVNGVPVPLTASELQAKYGNLAYNNGVETARLQRNALLFYSDWTQSVDNALSAEEKQAWATYRQALRDLTDNVAPDGTFSLPTPPNPSFNPLDL